MRSEKYWRQRAEASELIANRKTQDVIAHELLPLYQEAEDNVRREIDRMFRRFSTDGKLTDAEARRLLNTAESEETLDRLSRTVDSVTDPDKRRELLSRLNAPAYAARISRLEAVTGNIRAEMTALGAREADLDARHIIDSMQTGYYRQQFDLQQGLGFAFDFAALNQPAIYAALNQDWSGKNFSDRVWSNTQALADEACRIVTSGIAAGESVQQMTARLMDAMQSGRYAAVRVVRSEANNAYNQGRLAGYEEDEIERYCFVATLDLRTCSVCGELDRREFPVAEAKAGTNYPPMHPCDRCTTSAVIDEACMDGLQRRARDPVTGKDVLVPADMSYKEWKEKYIDAVPEAKAAKKAWDNRHGDRKQFGRYREVLRENAPKTFAKFQHLKYNNPEDWSQLKKDYRVVNRYEVDGDVPVSKILELDRAAWVTKNTGFDATGFHGGDARKIRRLSREGNAAVMDFDGATFFSHSRMDGQASLPSRSYIGEFTAIDLKPFDRRRYRVLDLRDGIPRETDTEAKFFEYAADHLTVDSKASITILSEKHICESCEHVRAQFCAEHPNVVVNIVSGKRGYNNEPKGTKTWAHRKWVK